MGSVKRVCSGGGERREVEVDHIVGEERRGARDGVVGEGQGLLEEDESRIGEDVSGDGRRRESCLVGVDRGVQLKVLPLPPPTPAPPPQQQAIAGPVVRWEKFLPFRSLKILLVESDDSTRQVVTALLRNCCYEVTATSNGLEAWKVLVDLTNHVDLVLTEVVMPCLSGIGLLCKIMSHKTCKNIPVIMMSSHDSMGIVFKCLSKGAVDFLVKPIRKNELKNLWQHVWRRCHSSSGSGSESGIHTQKSVKSKNLECDNNTGSNSEDDNASNGLNVRDDSDNGSGTQSSWTRRAPEIESPQPMSPSYQLPEPLNSTCAQVIHSKTETFCNEWVQFAGSNDEMEILANESMEKASETGVPKDSEILLGLYPRDKVPTLSRKVLKTGGALMNKHSKNDPKENNQKLSKELLEFDSSKEATEPSKQVADRIGVIAETDNLKNLTKLSSKDNPAIPESKHKALYDNKDSLSLQSSLKRLISTRDCGAPTNDNRNILRRSDLSAFSRYNTSIASNHIPVVCGEGSSFPSNNNTDVVKMESSYMPPSTSNVDLLNQGSNGSNNNNDVGSTTNNAFTKPVSYMEKPAAKPAVIPAAKVAHASAFHPVQQRFSSNKEVIPGKIDDFAASSTVVQPRGIHYQVKVQHHHYHHHHVHNIQQQPQQHAPQPPLDCADFTMKIMPSSVPQCGSSDVLSGLVECNPANFSVNGSVSGSNHGSNAHNRSSAAANTGGLNVDSESGLVAKSGGGCGNGSGSGSGSGSGVEENRFAQREAALSKFRQKRKERCFEKKVRYQSRQRLAEQRPRLRGQFVRQAIRERKDRSNDC